MAGSVDAVGTAGAGQSQPTEGHADQPQHQGHEGPGSPAAGAETTGGAAQMHHTEDHADQPQRQGRDGAGSSVAGADTTGGAGQSQPTDDQADQPHRGGHEGPGSPGGDADSAGGGGDGEAEVCGAEVYSRARIVDDVADAGQFSQFGIKLDCGVNIINYVTNAHCSLWGFPRWFV